MVPSLVGTYLRVSLLWHHEIHCKFSYLSLFTFFPRCCSLLFCLGMDLLISGMVSAITMYCVVEFDHELCSSKVFTPLMIMCLSVFFFCYCLLDTISRTVEGSDAHACFKMWPVRVFVCVGAMYWWCVCIAYASQVICELSNIALLFSMHTLFSLLPSPVQCCLPRCVGVQFALGALLCQAAGLYFALVGLVSENA